MECLLLRHGIAVEPEEWQGTEADRPLTDRGAKRVTQVAAGLRRLEVAISHLISSPLVRARETADIVRAVLHLPHKVRIAEELVPEAPPDQLLSLLRELPSDSCVLCVGHEPHLGMVASLLLSGKPSTAFPFKKAGACLIEVSSPVKPSRGTLRWWMGPSQLKALGKKQVKLDV